MERLVAICLMLGTVGCPSVLGQEKPNLPDLPRAVSSLGAIECNGYLYVYGGHCGKTHTYSTEDVLGTFYRLKLAGGKQWEKLPGGPIAQGLNLATHGGKIYRVGGFQPRNKPGEKADLVSLTDVARFDPKTKKWENLPPLPEGRSSHDVVFVKDKMVVVGGWNSLGRGEGREWHDTALVLDLSAKKPQWRALPQPFQRRALAAAALGNKVYVICGLDRQGEAHKRVDVLDLETGKWTQGPDVPGRRVGFSPAATVLDGHILVSTADRNIFRLSEQENAWIKVAESESKRIVHRLVPFGSRGVILVGGALPGVGGNASELEFVPIVFNTNQTEESTSGNR